MLKKFSLKSNLGYFHPKIYIPPWKYGDAKISSYETRKFTAFRSMHNIQFLIVSGGSCKYCCKCFWKIYKKNYCTVYTSDDGSLIRCAVFLRNTKHITYDKFQQAELEKK